ncbi:YidC/Oxa1 family membrane protein insertase [Mycetocola zhadangensis]|uniref:Membrane protein insertase YidC n=1 Tax=Mycetocola zhadangensis TaxID=1164595 RepID=A0A3L7ISI6_9MICO|nr:membrane protein insertase YidC [Mycetocola zhadangensis]RLQ81089.1 protein translocase component YidC [Mycetocola zhadangensis]GGF04679.1 membrane protein [Mycetocola zhadangensis]
MDIYSFAPVAIVLDFAYSLVSGIADLLLPLTGSLSTAVAIVAITLLVRTALMPVGRSQVRAEFTRRRLAPQLAELQRRYKKKPELLQQKTMELYTAEKASPLAGCFPTLLQAPVISTVYGLFILQVINGHPNSLLTEQVFGVQLGTPLVAFLTAGTAWPGVLVYATFLGIIATVAWLSRRAALRNAPPPAEGLPANMQNLTGILSWMPFITVIFAAIVPLAATLYLAVTTSWTLVERAVLRRRYEKTTTG